ncbi:FAD-dependent oxidoreductase [Leptospira idonii]|uniref:FAD-dependent oxidoreductase n=1 Tax=Leptospira idonii TaxID=1193500 RepID=A0A4R9M3P4_9LEPT|nr:FAD-dependent oxidoreductase [Leptospira idonii]TGN20732.1 FAD-dependent oxidoreductase [Leptospira idonii]
MIAVIGSGITGLTTAWALSKYFPVTLYEKHSEIGMAAFGAKHQINGHSFEFDIPFRTIKRDYYPTLFRIYDKAGILTRPVDYSFRVESEEKPVFGFRSYSVAGSTFGFPTFDSFRTKKGRSIFFDLLRFYANSKSDWKKEKNPVSILEFLKKNKYSKEFIHEFLLPTFALVNTCKTKTVGEYPAETIIGYHSRGYSYTPQETASFGTRDIVNRMVAGIGNIELGAKIRSIGSEKGKPVIHFESGTKEFDHIIVTTQANQAYSLLDDSYASEKKALSYFRYEASDVIVHSDADYLKKRDVSLLFKVDERFDKPEVTLDLGRIMPELKGENIFQTWNPHHFPEETKILKLAKFERPIVDSETIFGIRGIETLHSEANRKIWLCGSYSLFGIPLLEAGAKSAMNVAEKISKRSLDEILSN